ncbi:MAG: nicotinamide riboside transporter PnuC [Chitinophagaceae bacterium]|nr:MAG: nicotinamide riboside transporter PnuC [Chitinophagaceae bacterium]
MEEIIAAFTEAFKNPNWLEVAGIITALAYVFLASRENILCWPFAAISTTIYMYLVFDVGLYLETILQFFYLIMAFVGWYQWVYGKKNQQELHISRLTQKQWFVTISAGILLTFSAGFSFDYFLNNEDAYLDAFTTVFAFIATWMVVRKILENWLFWIVIDAVSIILYFNRGLYFSTFLYLLYTIIAIYGFWLWKKKYESRNKFVKLS